MSYIRLKTTTLSSKNAESCLTLGNTMYCSPPGSSVHGILQARRRERVAISYSRASSRPRDQTRVSSVSYTSRRVLYHCTTIYLVTFILRNTTNPFSLTESARLKKKNSCLCECTPKCVFVSVYR